MGGKTILFSPTLREPSPRCRRAREIKAELERSVSDSQLLSLGESGPKGGEGAAFPTQVDTSTYVGGGSFVPILLRATFTSLMSTVPSPFKSAHTSYD